MQGASKTSWVENGETSVVGRALVWSGYGQGATKEEMEKVQRATEADNSMPKADKERPVEEQVMDEQKEPELFPKRETPPPEETPTEDPPKPQAMIDTEKRARIGTMLMEMAEDDKEEAQQMLYDMTTFTGKDGNEVKGYKDTRYLKGRRLIVTLSKVEEAHRKVFSNE